MSTSRMGHRTAVSTSDADRIVIRGRDLCADLIGHVGFVDHYHLLLTGLLPSAGQRRLLDAVLVALADHGITPSVQAARMTLDAAPAGILAQSQVFVLRCADERSIALHLSLPEKFWTGLIAATGRPELFADPRWAHRPSRVDDHEALRHVLAEVFALRPLAEWAARLEAHDVPYAPVYQPHEVLSDPQARHVGLEITSESGPNGTFRSIRNPVRFEDSSVPLRAPPMLDEHREAILAEVDAQRARSD